MTLSPLENALQRAGIDTDSIVEEMRKSYSGTGGPLTALSISTKGDAASAMSHKTLELFDRMDRVGLTKLAVEKLPLGFPVMGRLSQYFGLWVSPRPQDWRTQVAQRP